MAPCTEGVEADYNGGITEGVPGTVVQGGEEMKRGKPRKQRKLTHFPEIVEDYCTQKHIGDDDGVRAPTPVPAQERHS
jgi:hypothetical protein